MDTLNLYSNILEEFQNKNNNKTIKGTKPYRVNCKSSKIMMCAPPRLHSHSST